MIQRIERVKKQLSVFTLKNITDKALELFQKEVDGQVVSSEEWGKLDQKLKQLRILTRTRNRDHNWDWTWAWIPDQKEASVTYLLTLIDDLVPRIPDLDKRILTDIRENGFHLEMGAYHICATTHCRAGFAGLYAESQGYFLKEHFGDWMCGALIYLKSTGRIPDFFATNEDAIADMEKGAQI